MESTHHDEKIKYWRQKLNEKKQKNQKIIITPKAKEKSHDKKLQTVSPRNRINSTLNKLKSLLDASTTKKEKRKSKGKLDKDGLDKSTKLDKELKRKEQDKNIKFIDKKITKGNKEIYLKNKKMLGEREDQKSKTKSKSQSKSKSKSKSKGKSISQFVRFKCQKFKIGKQKENIKQVKKKKKRTIFQNDGSAEYHTIDLSQQKKIWDSIYVNQKMKTLPNNCPDLTKSSVIIYDVSPQRSNFYYSTNRQNEVEDYNSVAETYLKSFLETIKFEQTKNFSKNKVVDCIRHNQATVNLEAMIHQQELKWLRLKRNLEKLKYRQEVNEYLQEIIRQVDENHKELQNVQFDGKRQKQNKIKPRRRIIDEKDQNINKQCIVPQIADKISFSQSNNSSRTDSEDYTVWKQFTRSIPFVSHSSVLKNNQASQAKVLSPNELMPSIRQGQFDNTDLKTNSFAQNLVKQGSQKLIYIEMDIQDQQQRQQIIKAESILKQNFSEQKRRLQDSELVSMIENHLILEVISQFTFSQKNQLFQFYNISVISMTNQELISLSQQPLLIQSYIQSDDKFINDLVRKFIHFTTISQIPLLQRINKPLGVQSKIFLKCMRALSRSTGDDDQSILLQATNEYRETITNEEYSQFQESLMLNETRNQYQYYFNRCIQDYFNHVFDTLRPFGKKGIPPIHFQTEYKMNTLQFVENRLKQKVGNLLKIKMGFIGIHAPGNISQIQRMISESLRLDKLDMVAQIEDEYKQKMEDIFQITYDLMDMIEEEIFDEQIHEISNQMRWRY